MLPIIRRIRRPFEVEAVVPQAVAATPEPVAPPPPAPAPASRPVHCENRTDSGQFSSSPLPAPSSALPAPTLWSRQPDESPEDYLLFAVWLELPVPRPARKPAAKVLACSYRRLSRIFVRHR